MYDSVKKYLQAWSANTNERQKIQHAYVVAVIALVIIAGLVGLVNYRLSQNILGIAFFIVILWVANLVAWALLQSLVVLPIDKQRETSKSTRAKTK